MTFPIFPNRNFLRTCSRWSNLLYGNGRNAIAFVDGQGGPHYLLNNAIRENGWNGVSIAPGHQVLIGNTMLTHNGVARSAAANRAGIAISGKPNPVNVRLLHNLICGNPGGEVKGNLLDSEDAGNLTPSGSEGPGVAPSPRCDVDAVIYAGVNGSDGIANSIDDDYALSGDSPALDHGIDPRTLGLDPTFNPIFEADFLRASIRPQDGDSDGTAVFDMGAVEFKGEQGNLPPVAHAGPDANAATYIPVMLDGSESYDPEDQLITFRWALVEAPTGSVATLPDVTKVAPQFIPDLPGSYIFELATNDGNADSIPDRVTVTVVNNNAPPNANAGRGRTALVGSPVTLNGSGSDDPNQTPLTFLWSFTTVPPGSSLTNDSLAQRDTPTPQFTPDATGTYILTLRVSDGVLSDEDTVQVLASPLNVPPNANAGADRYTKSSPGVALDGSMSADPDADPSPLSFSWTLVARPAGSQLTTGDLSDAATATPSFTPDRGGAYLFRLFVNDGQRSDTDNVLVVIDDTPPTLQFTNPTDGATVSTSTPTFTITFSDADAGVDLSTYQTLVNGVDVTKATTITPTGATYTTASSLPAGDNTATARIADRAGNVRSVTIRFKVSVFRAIADCGPQSGNVPLQVTFRSRGEFTGGTIIRYRWDFQGDGTFDTSDAVARDFTFTFNQRGTFNAVLEVTNNLNQKATDTCTIQTLGNTPTATANASPSNGPVPLLVNFTCTGSDPGGSIVLYEWDFEGDGVFDYSSSSSGNTSHSYAELGTFTAVCRVTDNDGFTGTARTTTTVIRPAPAGSPTVQATATPGKGNAPLAVSLNGSATDDGSIVLWEWDFDGDGTFDYSSPSSPATSFTYTTPGIYAAALRATDNTGLTSTDTVEVEVNIAVTLSIPDDTIDPTAGETATINTSLSAMVPVRLFLKDKNGTVVRTLVNTTRAAGTYADMWDGKNDAGQFLPQAPYFAVLEYQIGGTTLRLDFTDSTGGSRYNPARNSLPSVFRPFEDNHLTINFTIPANQGASEVQAFVGLFNTDTRFVTLLDRVPLGVGTHTIRWDGLDSNGNFAVAPPGDSFLFGIFGFTLPNNAIFLQEAPVLSNITVDPNYFDPATPNFLTSTNPVATMRYDLSKQADVELTVTNLKTGFVLRRIRALNVQGGTGLTVLWDGKTDDGLFVDKGDYRLALRAIDSTGSASLTRYALVKVFY